MKKFSFKPTKFRILKFFRNAKNPVVDNFYVFDTETGVYNKDRTKFKYTLKARPDAFIFGVVYGKDYCKVIKDHKEFIKEFEHERYKDKHVFAHNAEYDLTVLYDNIFVMDNEAIFNGKFIAATNGNCKFADSMNIYNFSVAKMGELLGLEKLDLNYDRWRKTISKKDIDYCIRDCKIVWDALLEMFEEVGTIRITQASLSLTLFLKKYLRVHLKVSDRVKYYWKSYYGGRTEAFKIGKTNALVYDINSSYPYAMKHCVLPNPRSNRRFRGVTVKTFIKYALGSESEGCAYVKVNHKHTNFGFLPYRKDGKLLFPVGIFSGWWNFNELRFAYEQGAIEFLRVYEYIDSSPLSYDMFGKYVDDLYNRRLDPDIKPFEKTRIKIFMNSLYGKFGQRKKEKWIYLESLVQNYDLIEEHRTNNTFLKLIPYNTERLDGFLVVKDKSGTEYNHSIPCFASYITSFARIQLLKKMLEWEKYGVVYCDTDSVFIEQDTKHIDEHELGGWKKENKIVTRISGLKNYEFHTTDEPSKVLKKLKGVPKNALEISPNTYEYKNLMKTKEGLKRNLDPGILTKRSKHITGEYDKRIVNKGDGSTTPIILNE